VPSLATARASIPSALYAVGRVAGARRFKSFLAHEEAAMRIKQAVRICILTGR
jgi:hypothetical protein